MLEFRRGEQPNTLVPLALLLPGFILFEDFSLHGSQFFRLQHFMKYGKDCFNALKLHFQNDLALFERQSARLLRGDGAAKFTTLSGFFLHVVKYRIHCTVSQLLSR